MNKVDQMYHEKSFVSSDDGGCLNWRPKVAWHGWLSEKVSVRFRNKFAMGTEEAAEGGWDHQKMKFANGKQGIAKSTHRTVTFRFPLLEPNLEE